MRKPSLCLFLSPLLVSACVAVPTRNSVSQPSPKPPSASPTPLLSPSPAVRASLQPSAASPSPMASLPSSGQPGPDPMNPVQSIDLKTTVNFNLPLGSRQVYKLETEPSHGYIVRISGGPMYLYAGAGSHTAELLKPLQPAVLQQDPTQEYQNYYQKIVQERPLADSSADHDVSFYADAPTSYLVLEALKPSEGTIQLFATNPEPTPTTDCCDVIRTVLNGKVFDDEGAPLDGVTIHARSLNSFVSFDATTTTSGGSYAYYNVPYNVQLELTASRPGYTSRSRIVVPKPNKDGAPNANRYDFGTDNSNTLFGEPQNGLSDKPEITAISPANNASEVAPNTSFVVKFSEPMDKASVHNNFEILAYANLTLSVNTSPVEKTLPGSGDPDALTGTRLYDKSNVYMSWNSDDTEVTFTLKEHLALPSDKNPNQPLEYQVAFHRLDGFLTDKAGVSRSIAERHFKLTDGNFERSARFSLQHDSQAPGIQHAVLLVDYPNVSDMRIEFDKVMQLPTLAGTIAGGFGGDIPAAPAALPGKVSAAQAAGNYFLTLKRAGQILQDHVSWSSLGGEATCEPTMHNMVRLTKAAVAFLPGDEIEIEAASSLLDPAGNPIDPARRRFKVPFPLP